MHQFHGILCQTETYDVKEMAIGIYLKGIKNVISADHRLKSI